MSMRDSSYAGNGHGIERKPVEIESDIERTRSEIGETLDAIQRKFSPGQMMDQAFDYFRNGTARDFSHNLGEVVKNNPVPIALVGIGLAWLAVSGSRGKVRPASYGATGEAYDTYDEEAWQDDPVQLHASTGSSASTIAASADGTWRGAKHAASGTRRRIGNAVESARNLAQGAREWVGDTTSRMQDNADYYADYYTGRTRHMAQRTGRYADRLRDRTSTMLHEQPFVMAGIGVAVGALLGAMFPRTQYEDEMMGGARDKWLDRAKEAGREQIEHAQQSAKEVAGAAMTAARKEAEKQDLVPGSDNGSSAASRGSPGPA